MIDWVEAYYMFFIMMNVLYARNKETYESYLKQSQPPVIFLYLLMCVPTFGRVYGWW